MNFTYGRWNQIFPTRLVTDPEMNVRAIAVDSAREQGIELLEGPPRASVPYKEFSKGVLRLEYPGRKPND